PNPRPPGSRTKSFHTCQGLRPRRAGRPLALTRPSMSPSVILTTSAPDTFKLSRLNGWPMRSPTDASTQPSRIASHGLGPMRFATPSSWRTFTTYSLPVLPAHQNSCWARSRRYRWVVGGSAHAERPEDLAPGIGPGAAPAVFASSIEKAPNAVLRRALHEIGLVTRRSCSAFSANLEK